MKEIQKYKNIQVHYNYSYKNELINIVILPRNKESVLKFVNVKIKDTKDKLILTLDK